MEKPRQMSYIWVSNVKDMKKKTGYTEQQSPKNRPMQESMSLYKTLRKIPDLKDFDFAEFKKIADKSPFTQAEWAAILHVSERTLQRYAKNNGHFAPINAERALQIERVLQEGKTTFGTIDKFYSWLQSNPQMAEGSISFNSLTTAYGIQMILTQLGRIQHGILA